MRLPFASSICSCKFTKKMCTACLQDSFTLSKNTIPGNLLVTTWVAVQTLRSQHYFFCLRSKYTKTVGNFTISKVINNLTIIKCPCKIIECKSEVLAKMTSDLISLIWHVVMFIQAEENSYFVSLFTLGFVCNTLKQLSGDHLSRK